MELGLKDKVVLITGAGQGLGRAIGEAFMAEGARVAFHFNTAGGGAEEAVARARAAGVAAMAYQADVRDRAQVDAMVAAVEQNLGPIDILVNNAAATKQQFFLESQPADWEPQIQVTITGLMHVCQSVLQRMSGRQGGSIVTLTGDSGRVGESRLAVTAAARAAAIGFSKALAKEMARYGVRVNVVALGLVKTPALTRHMDAALMDKVVKMYPLRRLGEMDEVSPTVLLLASDRTGWTTGQVLSINGGYSMV